MKKLMLEDKKNRCRPGRRENTDNDSLPVPLSFPIYSFVWSPPVPNRIKKRERKESSPTIVESKEAKTDRQKRQTGRRRARQTTAQLN
mmetsp:Transcript_5946/g.11811  ORF Transcript_5946/g.11811 Transcript_5946/m.11811 type:complete len:88 (+) Transcript_5946:771-1034(+)